MHESPAQNRYSQVMGDRNSRRSELVLRGTDELSEAVEYLLTEAGLSAFLDDEDKLPVFMRARDSFGYHGDSLPPNQYQKWLTRCKKWTERVSALHEAGATEFVVSLELERTNTLHVPIFLIPQICPMLHTLVMRSSWLSDSDLSTFAICMRGQLRSLDLSNSRGFRDLGIKSLAAFSVGLEELRLGGCEVTDEGIEKVAFFCKKLKVLELTDSPAVGFLSLSHLPATCEVERLEPPSATLLGTPPPGVTQARPVRAGSISAERARRAAIPPRASDAARESSMQVESGPTAAEISNDAKAERESVPARGSPTATPDTTVEEKKTSSWLGSAFGWTRARRTRRKSAIDRYWGDVAEAEV